MTIIFDGMVSLLEGVSVHELAAEDGQWAVKRADGSYVRVGADMGSLLAELRVATLPSDLTSKLGEPWTEEDVFHALDMAARMNIVGDERAVRRGPASKPARLRRCVSFVPPLTVQLTVLRPERIAGRVRPVLQAVPAWVFRLAGAVPVVGLVVLALQSKDVVAALSEPVSLWVVLVVALASFVATSLHELGHGAALTREGGTPTRLGVMLFYLTPAMFCDVSDGWLLPSNRQRVTVALAGVSTQAFIGGVCAISAGIVTED